MLLTPRIIYHRTLFSSAFKCMEKAQPASVHHKAYPHLTDQETLKSINVDTQMVCSAYLEGALWNLEFTKTKKKIFSLPLRMVYRSVQHWFLSPDWRFWVNLPQQEHYRNDSTGYKPHSFVRQYTLGLTKSKTVIINTLVIISALYSLFTFSLLSSLSQRMIWHLPLSKQIARQGQQGSI